MKGDIYVEKGCYHKHIDIVYYFCTMIPAAVLGYRSGGPGSIPGTTKKKSSGPGTGSTEPREYN
jgi:hypothetical protein